LKLYIYLQDLKPIDAFGIVAAMSRNHVIGVDGHLPWNLPEDRKAFVALTADKILIIGRRTFEEEPNQSHICHVARCIVVSNTMTIDNYGSDRIQLARSFPEALSLAKKLVDEMMPNRSKSDESDDTSLDNVECWVAGGEQLFHLALLHASARSLHLTVVDTDIDTETGEIAKFPAKYRWDNKFELEVTSESKGEPSFTEHVYRRIKGRR
jgi:dihydrofolate reductase